MPDNKHRHNNESCRLTLEMIIMNEKQHPTYAGLFSSNVYVAISSSLVRNSTMINAQSGRMTGETVCFFLYNGLFLTTSHRAACPLLLILISLKACI